MTISAERLGELADAMESGDFAGWDGGDIEDIATALRAYLALRQKVEKARSTLETYARIAYDSGDGMGATAIRRLLEG